MHSGIGVSTTGRSNVWASSGISKHKKSQQFPPTGAQKGNAIKNQFIGHQRFPRMDRACLVGHRLWGGIEEGADKSTLILISLWRPPRRSHHQCVPVVASAMHLPQGFLAAHEKRGYRKLRTICENHESKVCLSLFILCKTSRDSLLAI